ncbi:MAG TPA: MT-A70 family methyltransferase [Bacteroidales bacterium]|nr:MT-A70 family methyltransferase [Bacteroidales bacterium]
MEIVRFNKVIFEKNKLIIHDDITIDEWKELGRGLKQIEGSVQFWIGDWARFGEKRGFTGKYTDPKVYDELEEITGLDRKTLYGYKGISESIESSLRREDLSFSHHKEVASLPREKQEKFLQLASEKDLSVRELREEIRRDGIKESHPDLPIGKFRIIYADPPWKYSNSMPEYFSEQANHYQLMSIDEIAAMDIKSLAEDNAVLFLWVTSPILRESFKVIDAWGFEYKSSFVWDKIKHNMGHYNSVRHEFLLICTRGSCTPDNIKLFDSVQSIERTEHSEKPEFFREIIDTLYTHGRKIELFARKKVEGWEVFGNES